MSSQTPGDRGPVRARRTVASYDNYADAERAVDYLADQKFPVERVSIVGRDLKLVEQVIGRMTLGRAVLNGALSGALAGLLIGWLFTVFDWTDPVVARGWLILDGFWFGALVGALFGLIAHLLTGGRRDFASIGALQADHYDLLADEEVADEAERLIAGLPAAPARDETRFSRGSRTPPGRRVGSA
ncbi:MAG TPA: general stress protein [Baekduia sp.]|uniref:general stress protein n=1 Tax=Baekduia sp. TaxID=2600305 RepID=UPI002CF08099|nr:general stress protein [Baekduia sp.]HMJ32433.1 general stress protein [Baekduia sp.]